MHTPGRISGGKAVPWDERIPRLFEGKRWWLYLVGTPGEPDGASRTVRSLVQEYGIAPWMQIEYEFPERNLEFLRSCVDEGIRAPQPYLCTVIGGCSAAVVYDLGSAMLNELRLLSQTLQKPL